VFGKGLASTPRNFPQLLAQLLLVGLALVTARPLDVAEAQTIEWVRQFGSAENDSSFGVAVHGASVYVVGSTAGNLSEQMNVGGDDAFIQKYNANGNVAWTRQFGSADGDAAYGVAVDTTGVYSVGQTLGTLPGQINRGSSDAFVNAHDTNGNVLWTRQFGADFQDAALAVAVDSISVYVVGTTASLQPAVGSGAFARRYDVNGNMIWTRVFGSIGDVATSVAVNTTGIYVAGYTGATGPDGAGVDAFVRRYDTDGNVLWARQFGTAGFDHALAVAAHATRIYVVGDTRGTLPGETSAGEGAGFVRAYDVDGNVLWTRQFPADVLRGAQGAFADTAGVYAVGGTDANFDAFVRQYDANGNVLSVLQFGSNGVEDAYGVAANSTGVYFGGTTTGALPGQTTAGKRDSFLTKLSATIPPPPAVNDGGTVNSASFALHPAPLAPGSIAAVFGTNLNDGSSVLSSSFGPDGKLVTSLGGASVRVNNIPAPMFYSTPMQLGIQIPFEVAGQTSATIEVVVAGQTSASRTVFLDALAPGVFTWSQNGSGAATILHQDGVTPVTVQNPARPSEVVVLFATGLGALSPPLATGAPSSGNLTVSPASVTVDGLPAAVQYSGTTPGLVGLNQINFQVPPSARFGSDVPVMLSIAGKQSNRAALAIAP
jgi:uncharacterized protein (TIGR03437 family)